jgi:hypothetical protein
VLVACGRRGGHRERDDDGADGLDYAGVADSRRETIFADSKEREQNAWRGVDDKEKG